MKQWPGIRRDTAGVGDGAHDAVNVDYYTDGELQRRSGLAGMMPAGGPLLAEFTDPAAGVRVVHVEDDGDISVTDPAGGGASVLASSYNVARVPRWARSNNRLYITNDFARMKAIYAADVVHDAGIVGPAAAMGAPETFAMVTEPGPASGGPYLARYRYFNSRTLYYSAPSDPVTFTIPGGTTRTVTFEIGTGSEAIIRSTDSKVDQIIVQMTVAGGTEFYDVAYINQTEPTVAITMSSSAILLQPFTGANAGGDALPPPLFRYIVEHRKRLFGIGASTREIEVSATNASDTVTLTGGSALWAGRLIRIDGEEYRIASSTSSSIELSVPFDGTTGSYTATVYSRTPDMLYWSEPGFPEQWRPADARRVFADDSDVPTGMVSFYGALYIFSLTKLATLSYQTAPEAGELEVQPTDMGCWNQACAVVADNRLYGFGPAGAWTVVGTQPKHMSKAIDPVWRDDADASQSDKFFGAYDPRRRILAWFYVRTGQARPDAAICFDIDGQRWFRISYEQPKQSADIARNATGVPRLCLGGAGRSWFVTEGVFDGVAAGFEAIQVVDTGATDTVIPVTGALQSTLAGVVLYAPSLDEARVIASNTVDTITLATALSAALPPGAVVHMGRIPVVWDEKGNEPSDAKVRASQVHVSFIPDDGELEVTAYKDFRTNPVPFTRTAVDVLPNGVELTNGSGVARINMGDADGWVPLPGFADHARTWRLRMESSEPAGAFRILDLRIVPDRVDVGKVRRE